MRERGDFALEVGDVVFTVFEVDELDGDGWRARVGEVLGFKHLPGRASTDASDESVSIRDDGVCGGHAAIGARAAMCARRRVRVLARFSRNELSHRSFKDCNDNANTITSQSA